MRKMNNSERDCISEKIKKESDRANMRRWVGLIITNKSIKKEKAKNIAQMIKHFLPDYIIYKDNNYINF